MSENIQNVPGSIGFVTVRVHPEYGYFGGYLLINSRARPLEFHCTLPIKPSRAQSILYGATLDEFICGEQIARALVNKTKSVPQLVFTDTSAVLSLRRVTAQPVAYVMPIGTEKCNSESLLLPISTADQLESFHLDDRQVAVLPEYKSDSSMIVSRWTPFAANVDLIEPFGRILDALLEAHPAAKAA